jgi:hypothetical protein
MLVAEKRKAMQQMSQGPLADSVLCKPRTEGVLRELTALKHQTLATMHGSSYSAHAVRRLTDMAGVITENFDRG